MATQTATRKSADEIATLFARGRREGSIHLTRKQTQWLEAAAVAEMPWSERDEARERRQFTGRLLDANGQPAGVIWRLTVVRNYTGDFKLFDVQAYEAAQEQARQERAGGLAEAREALALCAETEAEHPELAATLAAIRSRTLRDFPELAEESR